MGKKKITKLTKTNERNESNTISQLIEQGNLALDKVQPELALKFFERAFSLDERNTQIIDSLAEVLLQLNESERAYNLLNQSIQLEPSLNPCKYLYIAQLQNNKQALENYQKGITLLLKEKNESSPENITQIDKQLSKAYCGVAELYLTDLCFEENAEQECENAVNLALSLNNSLDSQHLQASLRISQNRMSEACDIVENIFNIIKQNRAALAQRTIIEEFTVPNLPNQNSSSEDDEIYSEDLCITTAKMLIECSVLRPNLSRLAVELLTSLLEEDDENIQIWFLAGVAEMGPENHQEVADLEAATYYLTHAKEMIEEKVQTHQATMNEFEEEYSLITHHLKLVEQMIATSSLNNGNEESKQQQLQQNIGNKQEEEEEWSDDDEEDEDNDMELSENNK